MRRQQNGTEISPKFHDTSQCKFISYLDVIFRISVVISMSRLSFIFKIAEIILCIYQI